MIKMLTAYTTEVDFAEDALADLLPQLDLEKNLLKNSVGIISCYNEFIDTGVVGELCKALPFDTVGFTTLATAACGEAGRESLTLCVLTSDDVQFSTAYSADIKPDTYQKTIPDTYAAARKELGGDPSLAFAFLPMLGDITSSKMLGSLTNKAPGVPVFGTVSCSHNIKSEHRAIIHNGDAGDRTMALLLFHGEVNAKFFVISLSEGNIQKKRGTVTKSEMDLVMEVDGLTFVDYLESLGVPHNIIIDSPTTLPMMLDFGDGAQSTASGLYHIAPEGYALFGTEVPVGVKIALGKLDRNGILDTAKRS
ncbi:MAG: hypothetical protein LBS99_07975, partial [Clostridiales bacterium]|nr:hypothetical protein [Clostridiales bacterium]